MGSSTGGVRAHILGGGATGTGQHHQLPRLADPRAVMAAVQRVAGAEQLGQDFIKQLMVLQNAAKNAL